METAPELPRNQTPDRPQNFADRLLAQLNQWFTERVLERFKRWFKAWFDPFQIGLVILISLAALFVWSMARSQIVDPLDNVFTERLCLDHGEVIERTMTGFEASNRFGLTNRSVGYCLYGEGPNGEAPITLTVAETDPGPRYTAAKWIGVIIQMGIVSIFLLVVVDPVLNSYRWVRSKLSSQQPPA